MDLEKKESPIENQEVFVPLEKPVLRGLFLRMVYGCLTPMLLVDALCITVSVFVPAAHYFVTHNLLALPVAACAFTSWFAVLASSEKARRRAACVYPLMAALTFSAGYVLSAAAVRASPEDLLRAATCTCVVIMVASLMALFCPWDFTCDDSFLWIEGISILIGIAIFICGSVVILWEESKLVEMGVYSSMVVLFAVYLLHDMQLATGTGGLHLPPEEYAAGGAFLWTDIANIFLFALRILANDASP